MERGEKKEGIGRFIINNGEYRTLYAILGQNFHNKSSHS
jgi:hypothetical protein